MLIASKYEDIYPPYVKDFCFITDNSYTKHEMIEMEVDILETLEFKITWPTSLRFLERYSKLAQFDDTMFLMARYILELSMIELPMHKWKPSMQACASMFLTKKVLVKPEPWTSFLHAQTTYSEQEVRQCAREMLILVSQAHSKR